MVFMTNLSLVASPSVARDDKRLSQIERGSLEVVWRLGGDRR
jgi:hypothetical protein